ncbi:MAG: DUF4430 domain-containing protein [Saccharofermentans sp.]|nr:DUF4430 domain-containing protein [Saccharofermentans sp.]
MKKALSVLVFILILFMTGCGLKVTRIENTAPTTTDFVFSAQHETITVVTEEPVTEPSMETLTGSTSANETLPESTAPDASTDEATVTDITTTTKRQWTTRLYSQPETKTTVPTTARTTKPVTQPPTQSSTVVCSIEIECKTILNNIDDLKEEEKKGFVPSSGYILNRVTISLPRGSTVFDALKYVCQNNVCADNCEYCQASGIQLEYVFTPGYGSEYVRGIHQLYEKDCGSRSGWMYSVNGTFPNYGCNKYVLNDGDKIVFSYTCDLGEDLK